VARRPAVQCNRVSTTPRVRSRQPQVVGLGIVETSVFGDIVGQTNPLVVDEKRERRPALEPVVDRLGEVVPAREPRELRVHEGMKIVDQRSAQRAGTTAIGESGISFLPNALRRAFSSMSAMAKNGRRGMDPTRRLSDRPRFSIRRVQPQFCRSAMRVERCRRQTRRLRRSRVVRRSIAPSSRLWHANLLTQLIPSRRPTERRCRFSATHTSQQSKRAGLWPSMAK